MYPVSFEERAWVMHHPQTVESVRPTVLHEMCYFSVSFEIKARILKLRYVILLGEGYSMVQ